MTLPHHSNSEAGLPPPDDGILVPFDDVLQVFEGGRDVAREALCLRRAWPADPAELLDGEVQPDEVPPEAHSLVYLDRRWHRLHKELDGVAELLESSRFL